MRQNIRQNIIRQSKSIPTLTLVSVVPYPNLEILARPGGTFYRPFKA
jgi:hypothetical protein